MREKYTERIHERIYVCACVLLKFSKLLYIKKKILIQQKGEDKADNYKHTNFKWFNCERNKANVNLKKEQNTFEKTNKFIHINLQKIGIFRC